MLKKILEILGAILKILAEINGILLEIKAGYSAVNQAQDEVLLDNSDAKRLLKVADSTLYRWRKQRLIEFQLIGNKFYYKKSDLERLKRC